MIRTVLHKLVTKVEYLLGDCIKLGIFKCDEGWMVMEITCFNDPVIRLMDGTKGGGKFKTFEEAEAEVERILRYMETELTRKEIIRHFTLKWIRKEEQAAEFLAFREALLSKDYLTAKETYTKKFGRFSREAIPDKVRYQISLHI